jgi:aminopeptidase YwaD
VSVSRLSRSGGLAAVVLLIALAFASAPLRAAPPALPAASSDNALRHAAALSRQIGPRPAGQPSYLAAVEYMEGQLRAMGYEVERQPFTVLYFEARAATLRVGGPEGGELRPTILQYSAATSGAGVEGTLAPAGLGRAEEVARASVGGRIALIERGELTFREKVDAAAAAGAIAAVIYNNRPGAAPAATLGAPSRIPAVLITQEAGERFLAQLRQGPVRVHLRVETLTEQRPTWNVVGRRAGREARTIVIGAHLDSVEVSPGANDNASGIAAALEAARLLAGTPLALSVEIVGFGAEELGLYGSAHYVRVRGSRVAGMVNMDMVGRGELVIGNSSSDGRLVEVGARAAARLGLSVGRFRLGQSDHVSFERAGIPTLFIHTGDDPAIHTPGDTLDRLEPQKMAAAARLAAAVALEAGDALR